MGKLLLTVVIKGVPGTDPLHTVAGTPYFSNLHRLMQRKLPNLATPEQARGLAASAGHYPGGEPGDEARWTGLHDFVSGMHPGQKFQKRDLMGHMGSSLPKLEEASYGGTSATPHPPLDDFWEDVPGLEGHRFMSLVDDPDKGYIIGPHPSGQGAISYEVDWRTPRTHEGLGALPDYHTQYHGSLHEAQMYAQRMVEDEADSSDAELGNSGGTRYGSYTTGEHFPGSYKETLLRDPDNNFKSGHWDDEGVLAHLRTSQHYDENGEPGLHIEEIQSDLHQQARRRGYKDYTAREMGDRAHELRPILARARFSSDYARASATASLISGALTREGRENRLQELRDLGLGEDDIDRVREISLHQHALQSALEQDRKRVDPAPFAKNWHEVMFRRAVHDAASQGLNRVTWSPGQQHSERFGLASHFDSIRYVPSTQRLVAQKDGETVANEAVPPGNLAEYVGEDVAARLLAQPLSVHVEGATPAHRLESSGLMDTGGSGMRGFYGHISPGEDPMGSDHDIVDHGIIGRYANAYARKLHGGPDAPQVEASSVDGPDGERRPAFSLRITPQMRERILREGVPLWGHTDSSATDAIRKAVAVDEIKSEVPTHGVLTMKAFVYGVDNPYRPAGITRPGRHSLTPTLRIAPNTGRVRPPRLLTVVGMSAHNPSTIFHAPAAHDQVVNPVQVVPKNYAPSRPHAPAASPTAAPVVHHISSTQTEGGGMHHLLWSATPGHGAVETRDELRARGFVLQPGTWKKSRSGASHIFAATAPDGATHTFHVFRANTIGQSGANFNEPPAAPAPASGAPN